MRVLASKANPPGGGCGDIKGDMGDKIR